MNVVGLSDFVEDNSLPESTVCYRRLLKSGYCVVALSFVVGTYTDSSLCTKKLIVNSNLMEMYYMKYNVRYTKASCMW